MFVHNPIHAPPPHLVARNQDRTRRTEVGRAKICVLEVFKRVLQQREEDAALQAIALMHQGLIVDLTSSIALDAAKIGTQLKLPLADSVILATARAHNAVIWTQDEDFKDIKGVRYIERRTKSPR